MQFVWLIILLVSNNGDQIRAFPFSSIAACERSLSTGVHSISNGAENEMGVVMFCAPDLRGSRRYHSHMWYVDGVE